MRDKASQLEKVNQKIFEVMFNSDFGEEETDAADEYRIKYQQAKIAVSNILKPAHRLIRKTWGK